MMKNFKRKWFSLKVLLINKFSYYFIPLMPRNVTIEFTYNCNLRCRMCPRQIYDFRNTELSLQQITHILNEMPQLKKVNLCGLGEPFCHSKFFDILNLLKKRRLRVTFVTNGTLLNDSNIKKLPDNIHLIHVSLDTYDKKDYKRVRGVNLEKTVNNIRLLHKLRPEIRIVLNCLLMKKTLKNYHRVLELAKDVNAEVCMLNLQVFWEGGQKEQIFGMKGSEKKLKQFEDEAKKLGVRYTLRPTTPIRQACYYPFIEPYININGDIYACSYTWVNRTDSVPYFKEWLLNDVISVPQYEFNMGNIFKTSFRDIWFSKDYKNLRRIVKESNKYAGHKCPLDAFMKTRKNFRLKGKHDYCRICLSMWGLAC